MEETISIDELYSDVGSFDEEAVLRMLKGKVTFSKENEIRFAMDPAKLKAREVILLYALAKKALKVNQKIDDETFTSAEVTDKTKLNSNTVRGRMSELKDEKLLTLSGSRYEIPAFKVAEVLGLLEGKGI
jgi:hypothetical protein